MPWARRVSIVAVLLLAVAGGLWLTIGAGGEANHRHVVIGGVPLDEVHPDGPAGRRPGVVVAHGFAGSARLMAPFGDTLAARGYVVVLLDFDGHGASARQLPRDDAADGIALQHDLDVATTHLRSLPDVDPSRIALVGHSMGATAVTRYGAAHPELAATVAISLPSAQPASPRNLLLLVGGLEFPGFHTAARRTAGTVQTIPGVEHISILFAPRTHRETVAWLDRATGNPDRGSLPNPARRLAGAAILMAALAAGVIPLARLVLGPPTAGWPRFDPGTTGRALAAAGVAALIGALAAPFLPTARIPLSLGGYLFGLTTVTGAALIAYTIRRRTTPPARLRPGHLLLPAYAVIAVAMPLHLGLTYAVPAGIRWWLLLAIWSGFTLLAYGGERLAHGNTFTVLGVSALTVLALTAAAVTGLTSSFVLLVGPLLAALLLWQALWSAILHRFATPSWLIAATGSLLVAWPIATALPTL